MGVGVILVFIPVSALVLGTLPKSELTNGSSLHNLCKSTMTAIVASVASTLVARHSQMHQVYLVDNLSNFILFFSISLQHYWVHLCQMPQVLLQQLKQILICTNPCLLNHG